MILTGTTERRKAYSNSHLLFKLKILMLLKHMMPEESHEFC